METTPFVRSLPKAELHVHIEGTLEPDMMFALAQRNDVVIPFESVSQIQAAYDFNDLQSFLDVYYQGAAVLITEQDFYDLMLAYLDRAHEDGVRRAEIFFNPQTHTHRGVGFEMFMNGFTRAIGDAHVRTGISVGLIMSYLRHLPADDALDTWLQSAPYRHLLIGVGLDSSEVGNPPELFEEPFRLARDAGLHVVGHAGEEGPPSYITGALDTLMIERIDHGVRVEEDPSLLQRIIDEQIPLTMCPVSNLVLRVIDDLKQHNLKRLLDLGVKVTVNSDDPPYFGAYVLENYVRIADALDLTKEDLVKLARNSIEASFVDDDTKVALIDELEVAASA